MSLSSVKPTYTYARFRVRSAEGESTTVSVKPTLVVQAIKALGSLATVRRVVREAAVTYQGNSPLGKTRSGYVALTLQQIVDRDPRNSPPLQTPVAQNQLASAA
jgi:hypothetical protein